MAGIEEVKADSDLLALILRADFHEAGIHFFTPDDFSQQLAFMSYGPGKTIQAHTHNLNPRQVHFTQEALFIRKGVVRVDFFTCDQVYLESRILRSGDVILLAKGGHGFEILEEADIVEVKQGPFAGPHDKTRFEGIAADRVQVTESHE